MIERVMRARIWRHLPSERRDLLSASAATLGSRIIDLPSRYAFHLLIAYRLGVEGAGNFYILFSMLTLAAGAGRLGVDKAATADIARAVARGDGDRARSIVAAAFATVLPLAILGTLATVAIAAPATRHLFDAPYLAGDWRLAALSILPWSLSVIAAGGLLGLMRPGASQMIYTWMWPLLFCVTAVLLPLDTHTALLLLFGAHSLNAAVGFALLWRWLPAGRWDRHAVSGIGLLRQGWSLFTTEAVQLMQSSLPAMALGIAASAREVGYFSLAWRVSLILNLLHSSVALMSAPRLARAHAMGDRAGLMVVMRHSQRVVLGLGAVPLIALFVFARPILHMFGSGFGEGAGALRILLAGQFIYMVSVSTNELLGMTGHLTDLRRLNLYAAACLIIALLLLTPPLGAEGAAIASVLTALLTAAGGALLVRRHLGFVPLAMLFEPGPARSVPTN